MTAEITEFISAVIAGESAEGSIKIRRQIE